MGLSLKNAAESNPMKTLPLIIRLLDMLGIYWNYSFSSFKWKMIKYSISVRMFLTSFLTKHRSRPKEK